MFNKNLFAMVDRAFDLSDAEMATIHANFGARAVAFYMNGPMELHAWSPSVVKLLASKGYRLLPIYVCQQGGIFPVSGVTDAILTRDELTRYGIQPFKRPRNPVVLDIEAKTFQANPMGTVNYCVQWANKMREFGFSPVIYGTVPTILACDSVSLNAGYWAAAPITNGYNGKLRPNQLINILKLKTMGKKGNLRAWQYAFEVFVRGTNGAVDISVVRGNLARI